MGSAAKLSRVAYTCKSRAERSTGSKVELKLSPTPLSLSKVTEAEGKFHQDKMETSTCRR